MKRISQRPTHTIGDERSEYLFSKPTREREIKKKGEAAWATAGRDLGSEVRSWNSVYTALVCLASCSVYRASLGWCV